MVQAHTDVKMNQSRTTLVDMDPNIQDSIPIDSESLPLLKQEIARKDLEISQLKS